MIIKEKTAQYVLLKCRNCRKEIVIQIERIVL